MNTVSDAHRRASSAGLIGLQSTIAAATLGWLLLAPPAQGQMLLVPLTGTAIQSLPARALHGETRLIGTGPTPGSLIVEGRRDTLTGLFRHATLVLAVPPGGCRAGASA
ncbi:hypothetical protein [Sphingomonas oryzagri]|uniref:Uncharacterized protein n=1 Tax=Sphingomonas oryzagri TaxID=3042314 RepID=A0ABT6N702_9SPHN|nr:hypothetical protein [Sphingomonas oryzagri]MDH7640904.1 hypothetical protein [Sphingomonas oryzagri]